GADEDVLADASPEELDIELHVRGDEADELDRRVEAKVAQGAPCRLRVAHVGVDHLRPVRHGMTIRLSPAKQGHLDAPPERQANARRADDAGPADDEDLHRATRRRRATNAD